MWKYLSSSQGFTQKGESKHELLDQILLKNELYLGKVNAR